MTDVRFIEAILGDGHGGPNGGPDRAEEDEALDAYSRIVTRVAETLSPSVANLRVSKRYRQEQGGDDDVRG